MWTEAGTPCLLSASRPAAWSPQLGAGLRTPSHPPSRLCQCPPCLSVLPLSLCKSFCKTRPRGYLSGSEDKYAVSSRSAPHLHPPGARQWAFPSGLSLTSSFNSLVPDTCSRLYLQHFALRPTRGTNTPFSSFPLIQLILGRCCVACLPVRKGHKPMYFIAKNCVSPPITGWWVNV